MIYHYIVDDEWIGFRDDFFIMTLDENGCFNGNCGEFVTISSSEISLAIFIGTVYPNPTADYIHIKDATFDNYKIYDINSKLIQSDTFSNQIDIQGLSQGTYFLHLMKDGVVYAPYKVVKN